MLVYVVSAIIIWITYRWLRSSKTVGNYGDRYVLITGCDTGFGNMLTKRLDGLGFHVFAGCLSEKAMEQLDEETSSNVTTVCLDVTKTESIETALEVVKPKLPNDKGLWGIVNNAGITGAIGPCDWMSRDDYRQALEVNTLGMIETTRVFLPLVIQSKGRIVNITSMMGRIAAVNAPYNVSKFAAEGYSDSLRRELYKRGVTVHILEPGYFKTTLTDAETLMNNMDKSFNRLSKEMQEYFGRSYLTTMKDQTKANIEKIANPQVHLVIDAYTHALTSKYPNYRYIVGNDAKYFFRFLWNAPEWLSDFVLNSKRQVPFAEQT